MHNFHLVENSNRGKLPQGKEIITKYLTERGARVDTTSGYLKRDQLSADTDCIIVLGGDGTLIRTAIETMGMNIPIIGVNVGRLGYLTSVSNEDEMIPMLEKLLAGEYTIETRYLIKGMWSDTEGAHTAYAFNDICIGHKEAIHAVRLEVDVNGEFLNEYTADGIIIATPTGSTAYNLSAGGPIIEADEDNLVVTPICPHAMAPSAMVLNMKNVVEVKAVEGRTSDNIAAIAVFDGQTKAQLSAGESVQVTKAEYTVPMIRLQGTTYFSTLRKKLQQLHG